MDNLTITLCEQIKLATAQDSQNEILITNAFIALTKIIKLYPTLNKYRELQNKYELLVKQLFCYLVYQELKISDDVEFSELISNILNIKSNKFVKILNEDRERETNKQEQKNLNYQLSIKAMFREINAVEQNIIPSKFLLDKMEEFLQGINSQHLTEFKINFQENTQVLVGYLKHQEEPENAAEVVSVMIDMIPQIQAYLPYNFKEYYEQALPATRRDIKKNLYKFARRYRVDFSDVSNQNYNTIKKKFINWVVMIAKCDCIDILKKNKRRKAKNQATDDSVSLDSLKSTEKGESINRYEVTSDRSIDGEITLSGLNSLIDKERQIISDKVIQYIQEDVNRKLQKCHVRNKPECNCQTLLTKRLIEKKTLEEIARELSTKIPTIQDYITYRDNPKRPGGKCFKLLIKEVEAEDNINLSEYK